MLEDTYGHTPVQKAFAQADPYGVGYDEKRAARPPLRLAICGAGGVAQSKYLPAIARLRTIWEPVAVTAISEPRRDHAEKVAALYGCHWYADWREMIAQEDLDGVLVTTPDSLHSEIGLACLERGLPVLVEKPITQSLVDSERLCRKADEKGLVLMAVANKRYSPPYRRAKHFVAAGPVTNPALYVGKFNLGYDYVDLLEGGTIHVFDLTRYLMGDVRTVRAVGIDQYKRNWQGYPLDNAVCQFEFISGAVGALYTSASALSLKPWERVEVYGDHAWLSVEDQYELRLYDSEDGPAKSWTPIIP
ncbi:MAG: Gfo/Idh/MocA family oxidoreductase, partial [Anaerolineae bacterium]|nr:Gfo/Idh/MocA family oxidoreductase [Anaerolineae bacterium]